MDYPSWTTGHLRMPTLMPLLFLLSAAAGCAGPLVSSPEIRGQVIQAASGEPIEGAIVYAMWDATFEPRAFLGEAMTQCYHSEITTSDSQGRFVLPEWAEKLDRDISFPDTKIGAYKFGYGVVRLHFRDAPIKDELTIPLAEVNGGADEQIQEMRKHVPFCYVVAARTQNLYLLRRTLYYDARGIASNAEQLRQVEILREGAAVYGIERPPGDTNQAFNERVQRFKEDHLR